MSSTFQQNNSKYVIMLLEILQNEGQNVYTAHKKVGDDLAKINVLETKIERIRAALEILEGSNDQAEK
jgi:hypothetical protein